MCSLNVLCCCLKCAACLLLFEGGMAMKAGVCVHDKVFKVKISLKCDRHENVVKVFL